MDFTLTKILTENPNCRERRARGNVLSKLLKEKYPHELGNIDLARIWDIVGDGISWDRSIRKVQQDNESLRGNDYNDKVALQQEKELNLGYEVGFGKKITNGKIPF